jgi:hypothetical protein
VAGRQVARRELQRQVFAASPFMQRCQEWPRGYAGDFETIEYLVAGVNCSAPETLGWHIEGLLLESPVVQQHCNKLRCQSQEIAGAVTRSRSARVLSIGCGGCLDWVPILPQLKSFTGEIVLNDSEPAALELAERRLRSATTHYRLAPGNFIRIVRRLADCPGFDLVLAGGLFDYLSHRATGRKVRKPHFRNLFRCRNTEFRGFSEAREHRADADYPGGAVIPGALKTTAIAVGGRKQLRGA